MFNVKLYYNFFLSIKLKYHNSDNIFILFNFKFIKFIYIINIYIYRSVSMGNMLYE